MEFQQRKKAVNRIRIVIGLAVVLAIGYVFISGTFSGQQETEEFSPEGGRFSVMFPSEPGFSAAPSDTLGVNVTLNTYYGQSRGIGYVVSYLDLPAEAMGAQGTEELLSAFWDSSELGPYIVEKEAYDGIVAGNLGLVRGYFIDRYNATAGGYPCRHISMMYESRHMELRYCLAGSRMYILTASDYSGEYDTERAKGFFDSFSIIQ